MTQQGEQAEDGGSHYSSVGSHQQGIRYDSSFIHNGTLALPQQVAEQVGEQSGNEGNVKATKTKPKSMFLFSKRVT